jgi:hypothetical protein
VWIGNDAAIDYAVEAVAGAEPEDEIAKHRELLEECDGELWENGASDAIYEAFLRSCISIKKPGIE